MHYKILLLATMIAIISSSALAAPTHEIRAEHYLKLRTKFSAQPTRFSHDADDSILNALDTALEKISTIYMQALFSGTHTPELDVRMRSMEIELFDLLDALYRQQRMAEYMKYEGEVTRQMILYNMLKKLFGYSIEENEKVK